MSENTLDFIKIKGRKVAVDSKGRVRLNDIHKAGGFSKNQLPSDWGSYQSTIDLVIHTAQKSSGKSGTLSKDDMLSVYCVKMGRGGGIWAHLNLALAYAKYLSPALHYEVNEVFLRYKSGDATLADDVLQRAPAKDNEWAGVRALVRSRRNELTETLQEHEVTKPVEFARVTNATYKALTDRTAKQLKIAKGLKPKDSLRDAMTTKELVFVMAAEQLAKERIEEEDSRGVVQCETAASKSASSIRRAIEMDRADRRRNLL
jgi:hypothetical protein